VPDPRDVLEKALVGDSHRNHWIRMTRDEQSLREGLRSKDWQDHQSDIR
jgi:hypothetical protein